MKILETERLRLRTITPDDAPFYLELVNDPGFINNIGDRGIRTIEAAINAMNDGPIAMQATLGHSIYLVELKEGGAPIGMSGLIKRPTLEDVDIGYAFLPQFCGQGYAAEAAAGVVLHARAIGLKRLVAITKPENAGSIRLLSNLGLTFERFGFITSETDGSNVYAMALTEREESGQSA
jgi:RimJ/RimL family protein N-acetyltransferase